MEKENKKIVIDKRLPIWLIPIRSIYRGVRSLMSNKPKIKQLTVNGYELLVWANEDIGKSLMLARQHEADEVHFFENNIQEGDVCLDVGANVGYYSMLFAQLSGANGKVYAFEPLRRNCLAIELASEINHYKNLEIFQGVASDKEGFVNIVIPEGDGAYAHIISGEPIKQSAIVQSITLDDFAQRHSFSRIDVIKIDVEGSELLVLQGAGKMLGDPNLCPRIVMIELASELLRHHNSTIPMVLEYMRKYSYMPYVASKGASLIPYTTADFDKVFNIFFKQSN